MFIIHTQAIKFFQNQHSLIYAYFDQDEIMWTKKLSDHLKRTIYNIFIDKDKTMQKM